MNEVELGGSNGMCVWSWSAQGEGKPGRSRTGVGETGKKREQQLRLPSFHPRSAHRVLCEKKVRETFSQGLGTEDWGQGDDQTSLYKTQTCSGNIISYKLLQSE